MYSLSAPASSYFLPPSSGSKHSRVPLPTPLLHGIYDLEHFLAPPNEERKINHPSRSMAWLPPVAAPRRRNRRLATTHVDVRVTPESFLPPSSSSKHRDSFHFLHVPPVPSYHPSPSMAGTGDCWELEEGGGSGRSRGVRNWRAAGKIPTRFKRARSLRASWSVSSPASSSPQKQTSRNDTRRCARHARVTFFLQFQTPRLLPLPPPSSSSQQSP